MSEFVTLDQIKDSGLKQEVVEVPEWGGIVRVRELTADERDEYEQSLMEARRFGKKIEVKPNFKSAKAKIVCKCIIDEAGNRMLADKDVLWVGKKSSAVLNRLADVIQRLSGMMEKDLEDLEGNSGTGQSEDSSSD